MPLVFQYCHAAPGKPPLHPKPHVQQQETKFSAEKWKFLVPLE